MSDISPGSFTVQADEWPFSPQFHDFASSLGLNGVRDGKGVYWPLDQRTTKKINDLYDWGKSRVGTDDHEAIKVEVDRLRRKVGTNWQGETLVNHLWQTTRMDTSRQVEGRPKPKKVSNPVSSIDKQIEKTIAPLQKKIEDQTRKMVAQRTQEVIKSAIQAGIKNAFR